VLPKKREYERTAVILISAVSTMPMEIAVWWVRAFYAYVVAGLLLLPWWHARGLRRLDAAAAHGPWGFRLLVSPGLIALWPWMLRRAWRARGEPAIECTAHRARVGQEVTS
jgi:hypothetical protein